jgi:hypothetical protein
MSLVPIHSSILHLRHNLYHLLYNQQVTCICEVKPWWVVESIAVTMLWWIGEVIAFCFLSSSLSDGDGLLCLHSLEISGVLKIICSTTNRFIKHSAPAKICTPGWDYQHNKVCFQRWNWKLYKGMLTCAKCSPSFRPLLALRILRLVVLSRRRTIICLGFGGEIEVLKLSNTKLKADIDALEQYGRRELIRFSGIVEKPGENTTDVCKVFSILQTFAGLKNSSFGCTIP